MFQAEIAKLTRMASISSSASLKTMLGEVAPLATKVTQWATVPTSGSVVCRYDTATGMPRSYEVKAQAGNLGNIVHELTHVAVNEAYKQDFVNYPNKAAKDVPARTYDAVGRCTNEERRQARFMDDGWNARVSGTLRQLLSQTTASELPPDKKAAVSDKLNYGMLWPHKEYDTVVNQVLVWLFEWSYPIAGQTAKKPVVNVLFEDLEKAVHEGTQHRRVGA